MPSTVIDHFTYDAAQQVLKVTFLSGALYAYYHVPEELYLRMVRARSKGKFLNTYVKDHYSFEKLSPG